MVCDGWSSPMEQTNVLLGSAREWRDNTYRGVSRVTDDLKCKLGGGPLGMKLAHRKSPPSGMACPAGTMDYLMNTQQVSASACNTLEARGYMTGPATTVIAYIAGVTSDLGADLAHVLKRSRLSFFPLYLFLFFCFLNSPFIVILFSFLPPALVFYLFFSEPVPGVPSLKNLVIPLTYEELHQRNIQEELSPGRARLALTLKLLFTGRETIPSSEGKEHKIWCCAVTVELPPAIPSNSGFSIVLQATANRRAHSLTGNIAGPVPTKDFLSASIPALGGVRHVLTEYMTGVLSSDLKTGWDPLRFPRQMTNIASDFKLFNRDEDLGINRDNQYVRHFPKLMTSPQLPQFFVSTLRTLIAFKRNDQKEYNHRVECKFDRIWEPNSPNVRPLQERFVGLSGVLSGSLDQVSLKAAEQVGAINRFLDSRGNRQVTRWEADQWGRWLRVANFAAFSGENFSYTQVAFRLWARFFACQAANAGNTSVRAVTPLQGTGVTLTFINARPVTGPNALNPEGPMWTDDAQDGLRMGTKQFIDAEGLSEPELIELLTCMLPFSDIDHAAHLAYKKKDTDSNSEGESSKGKGQELSNLQKFKNTHNLFLTGPTRYVFPNGVDEIFIHYGNSDIPDANTQQRISESVFCDPSAATIGSVIRYLATKHNAIRDLEQGLEAVLYRGVVYKSDNITAKRENLGSKQYINADGNWQLHLPRDLTASAYFDALRVPLEPSPKIQYMLAMHPREVVQNSALVNHARAVSLNWASYALSMLGQQWGVAPGTATNQFIRNHVDVWLRQYGIENINIWSTLHANAMALQYGFAPSTFARSTEGLTVLNWWTDYQAPYLANPYHELWMMEMIPSHQLLPFYDEDTPAHPTWVDGRPHPTTDFMSFQNWVEVARDLSPFSGRTWMSDGGATRNAQFYVAQGVKNQFRFQGGQPKFKLSRWTAQYQHQAPQNPADQDPTWMEPINSPFADFLLPGSLPALNMSINRVYAWGVHMQADSTDPLVSRRWHSLSIEEPNESLMINYIHPLKEKRQIESLHDYSIFIWEKDNRYVGMTSVRYDMPDVAAGARFDPAGIPAMPNYDIPTMAGDEYRSVQPGRVAKNKRKNAKQQNEDNVDKEETNPRVKVTRYLEHGDLDRDATLTYKAKYPVNIDQVPTLPENQVHMTDTNIIYDPVPLAEARTPLDRLALIDAKLNEADDFEEQLHRERAELCRIRDEARQQQIDIAKRVAASSRKHSEGRRRFTNPDQATYLNPGMRKAAPAYSNIPVQVEAVPNDANSGQAQSGVGNMEKAFSGQYDMADEIKRSYTQIGGRGKVDQVPATDFLESEHQPVVVTGSLPRTVYGQIAGRKRKNPEEKIAASSGHKPKNPNLHSVGKPGGVQADGSVSIEHGPTDGSPHANRGDGLAVSTAAQEMEKAWQQYSDEHSGVKSAEN
ncbi:hypothetical protein [Macrophomina phaseolina fusagravirus 1]|uniref:Uncharacterized protein n=1 Tax=Macrophomina phaseolina fusagravirus 1 TaxID=2594856 RepID=A0A515KU39_9VIRU|nr:hypothetical protein [Macrophomina phaseolina fusagravirus 1]